MVFTGCSPDITFAGISIIVCRLMPASRKVSIRLLSQQYAQCFSLLVIVQMVELTEVMKQRLIKLLLNY